MAVDEGTPMTGGSAERDRALQHHCKTVVRNLRLGRITPVLGAGASLYGRDGPQTDPRPSTWTSAPSAGELAAYLVDYFDIDEPPDDLLRVAQWIYATEGGSGDLYHALHDVFKRGFQPTALHTFLAEVASAGRTSDEAVPPLIVTTNYDDLVEQALTAHDEPYELLVYMADGPHEGRFCHVTDDDVIPILEPDSYLDVDPDKATVVLKMHGYVSRHDSHPDSYVITEDHYIEYLSRTELKRLLPNPVVTRLFDNHLLFLGYSLRDWNFRAILYYIARNELHDNDWWAVQLNPDLLQVESWRRRGVKIIDMNLEEYIPTLRNLFSARVAAVPDG